MPFKLQIFILFVLFWSIHSAVLQWLQRHRWPHFLNTNTAGLSIHITHTLTWGVNLPSSSIAWSDSITHTSGAWSDNCGILATAVFWWYKMTVWYRDICVQSLESGHVETKRRELTAEVAVILKDTTLVLKNTTLVHTKLADYISCFADYVSWVNEHD